MTSAVLSLEAVRFGWPQPRAATGIAGATGASGAPADVIDVASFVVNAQERVLLRGESGAGKSTLLSIAAGVLQPRKGCVRLLGEDWRSMSAGARDRYRAEHIGYIFQQFNLLPYLSVLDNVLLPCRFSATRRARAGATLPRLRESASGLLQTLQLETSLWSRPAGQLSVGQQQRVAAARAMIGAPELVIADEPTSALDEARRDAFMTLLVQVCERAGSALLFVSHDPRLAPHFSRVVDLASINQVGSPRATAVSA